MNDNIFRPTGPDEFKALLQEVTVSVDIAARLPAWPFRRPKGYVTACEFDHVLGSNLIPVIEALANHYQDKSITLMTLDPAPDYYWTAYGYYPSFRLDRESVRAQYWLGLSEVPSTAPAGAVRCHGNVITAVAYTGNVITLVGASTAWSVWAQRDWEIALLLTDTPRGPWLESGVRFTDISQAIATFRAPSGWSMELSEDEIGMLLANAAARGNG